MEEKNKKVKLEECDVDIKSYYILSKASLGQIIYKINSLQYYEPKTNNEYQKKICNWFKEEIPKFINHFEKILESRDGRDYEIRHYNIFILKKGVEINSRNHRVQLRYSRMGKLIEALKQRCDHLSLKEMPYCYIESKDKLYFRTLQRDIMNFLGIIEEFEKKFSDYVKEIRENKRN